MHVFRSNFAQIEWNVPNHGTAFAVALDPRILLTLYLHLFSSFISECYSIVFD